MNKKIKKLLLYFLFALACMFIFNFKTLAYTGTDTVNIVTDNKWANNYNLTFNDNVDFNQDIFESQFNYMLNQINQDKLTLGADYYVLEQVQGSNVSKEMIYTIYYYSNDINSFNLTTSSFYVFESSGYSWVRVDLSTTIKGKREIRFPNSTNTNVNFNSLNTSTSTGYITNPIYMQPKNKYELHIPSTFFVKTDMPKTYFDNLKFIVTSGYTHLKINDLLLNKGSTYYLSGFFDFITITDTTSPVLDFSNIIQPVEFWQFDDFTAPIPIAIDDIDGNISSNIVVTSNINTQLAGNYTVEYNVCDSHNNCTTASIFVVVKQLYDTVDMTGKSAILFYYKDFSQVKTPNSFCDTIDLFGNCFIQDFYYQGRWKYSKVLFADIDNLLDANGGFDTSINPPQDVNYKDYKSVPISHLTDNIHPYGIYFYNESGANTVHLKYNKKYFKYIIYNSLNDTTVKDINYLDSNGNNQNVTDITPPYTELEEPAYQNNYDTGGLLGSFTTNTYGLTAIISQPLILINQLTNKSCQPLILPLPYLSNKTITLPCMSSIYDDYFGVFFDLYQTISFGVVAYWVIVSMLNMIKDFKNPNHDEIEVLDL